MSTKIIVSGDAPNIVANRIRPLAAAIGNVEVVVDDREPLRIELYRDTAREWRWRSVCPRNGNRLAGSSEGYKNKSDCTAMIARHFGTDVTIVEVNA